MVLLVAVKELPSKYYSRLPRFSIRRGDIIALPAAFWWVISIASLLSLARFSQAFLVLKANDIGVDAAFVPMVLVVMHLMFSLAAYPFGILADRFDRRLQLGIGAIILIGADAVLAMSRRRDRSLAVCQSRTVRPGGCHGASWLRGTSALPPTWPCRRGPFL